MSEVSTRPRKGATIVTKAATAVSPSKTVPAEPIENEAPSVKASLKAVRDAIYLADHKLEAAYDATERGTPVERMVELVAHDLMNEATRPILDIGVPTRATSEAVYTAMFTPLAVLEGAIALAGDAVFTPHLQEAFRLLDWANSQMGSCAPLWKLLPEGADEAAPAEPEATAQEPYYEADQELRQVRNISVLMQWIERARLLAEKVAFWQQHSPKFASAIKGFDFDAPSWDDAESDALLRMAIEQELKVCELIEHLERKSA